MRLRRWFPPVVLVLVSTLAAFAARIAAADAPRVLPPGQLPHDHRLGPLVDLNGYFPFTPPATKEAWARRAERIRRQMLVATGLWPMPAATPSHAVIHGKIDRDGYTVEKVYFQSFPGHFVTGNLYRPMGKHGKLPAVLSPHGHWPNGRFYDAGPKQIRWSIVEGAERFERSGRYPIQARCVQLVRMGCVVFNYDMVGRADSVQLPHSGCRPKSDPPGQWSYFSPQAELRQENMMGLQTYNSIRALDFLTSLPDVDPKRIGVTGASGGGTQTFILCAIDPRPAVAFPAVMVSTAMQGGCTCENACYLRIGTSNVEFAALFAPRPLGMTAAHDWTQEIATKGLPQLEQLYRLLGAAGRVMARPLVQFPHNYNYVSRAVMYSWMNKYLKLGFQDPIVEEDFVPLSIAEMSVWDAQHPKPPSGVKYERSLLKWIANQSQRQMESLVPTDAASLKKYRHIVGGAIDVMIGRRVPKPGDVTMAGRKEQQLGPYRLVRALIRNTAKGEEVPAILFEPKQAGQRIVLWIDGQGKQALSDAQGMPKPAVRTLLDAGATVVGIDLFGQGEFTRDGKPLAKARLLTKNGWDRSLAYTLGYNPPLFSKRVDDILTALACLKKCVLPSGQQIDVLGANGAGPWVAAARAQAGGLIARAAIDTAGFRFAKLAALDDPDFLPGGAKYLDLPGILALSAPYPLFVTGEEKAPKVLAAAYRAAGHPAKLAIATVPRNDREMAAIEWLGR